MRTVATGNRKYHQRKVKPNCDSDLSGSRRARFHIPGRIKELKEDPAPLGPVTVGAGAPPSPHPHPGVNADIGCDGQQSHEGHVNVPTLSSGRGEKAPGRRRKFSFAGRIFFSHVGEKTNKEAGEEMAPFP